MVVLHNAATDAVDFLGRKQIANDPSLYNDAIAACSVAVAFLALARWASGLEANVSKYPWCPFADVD